MAPFTLGRKIEANGAQMDRKRWAICKQREAATAQEEKKNAFCCACTIGKEPREAARELDPY